jgi:hypothetical protein
MLIKVVAREKDPLPFILNHGMQISSNGYNSKKIMEKNKIEKEIYSMLYGFLTYS